MIQPNSVTLFPATAALIALLGTVLLLSACAGYDPDDPNLPQTVPHVDLDRYVGQWYEIARYDNRFQKECVASTAEYILRSDGKIEVINRCRKNTVDGKLKESRGKAWVVDKTSNARLKVQFFWPFRGDYWIIDLDEEKYTYAVVGHPSRQYLWVLARSPRLDAAVYAGILQRLEAQRYDTSRLKQYPPATE
ncbi:MAG: lipocalin family protein [Acidobacteria bacterium]|nr:lipocalin family protein [Acidobacteriota bacterium]